jgi:hypothetical protein
MSLVLTGAGSVVLSSGEACDPLPYLPSRKHRKFMGLQDDLAVVAAGKALASAGLKQENLGERAGLFLAVGYIPFVYGDIEPVLQASISENHFDLGLFGSVGFRKAHPLLTFRCLPNMPAYHISACFNVQGPYFVSYPGVSEFYAVLEEAVLALESHRVDVALVGGVAAQSNFLVKHHFARLTPPVPALTDAAGVLVLERAGGERTRGTLEVLRVAYDAPTLEDYAAPSTASALHGAAELAVALAARLETRTPGAFTHTRVGREGVSGTSTWVFS